MTELLLRAPKFEDRLGAMFKKFESQPLPREIPVGQPVVMRLDGHCFKTFTKHLKAPERPYHDGLARLMIESTRYLVRDTRADLGYTQSDEITLVWSNDNPLHSLSYNGRVQKLLSLVASSLTGFFVRHLPLFVPEKAEQTLVPTFDARLFCVPSLDVAALHSLWREVDAVKNATTLAASAYYPHQALHKVGGRDKRRMLLDKGVAFDDYPEFFRRGTYLQRTTVEKRLSEKELARIPEHNRPTGPVQRSVVNDVPLPPLITVQNMGEVLFEQATPVAGEPTVLALLEAFETERWPVV